MRNITAFALALLLAGCVAQQKQETGINAGDFNGEVDGKKVSLVTITNPSGIEADITNYGGRIVALRVPDRDGNMRDVVLGHKSLKDYLDNDGNFGALIGRYGNRIANGRFTLGDSTYTLPQNNYGHCLHGGNTGYHNAVWDIVESTDSSIVLSLTTPAGYEGFPGEVTATVTYTMTAGRGLRIDYDATTDAPTILNLTNHSYFNLSGDGSKSIVDEELYLNADRYTPIDTTFIPTGELATVEGTPFDFRVPKAISAALIDTDTQIANGHGIDHNYVLSTGGSMDVCAASVRDASSGICMDVFTDQPGVQVYIGNFLDGTVEGKSGIRYPHRSAICLETQHYPDSPNHPEWPSVVLNPGDNYHTSTIYRFSTF